MPLPVDSPARREARAGIKKIAKAIKDLGVDELDLQQLKSLNIRVDFLSLDEVSPHRATFFAPCPVDQLPDFNDDTVSHPYNGIDDDPKPDSVFYCPGFHRPLDRSIGINIHLDSYIQSCRYSRYFTGREFPWTSKPVAFYPFTGLYRHSKPEHGCFCLTDLEDPAYPHVKAIVFNNIALQAESTLLYGELLPALRIMLTQLRRSQFANQTVSPVLFISLLGLKARIMEFYFSNGTLVVRHTKMFDFTHGNDEAFKTLAQWYLGDAIGDTVNGV